MPVLAIVPDLIFASKITAEARAQNLPLLFARTAEQLRTHLASGEIAHVLIDLNGTAIDPLEAIGIIRAEAHPPRITAFASHVDEARIAAAHAAGADKVIARSAFTYNLAAIMGS